MTAEQSLNHPWISPQSRQQEEERRHAQTNIDNFKSYQARRRWKVRNAETEGKEFENTLIGFMMISLSNRRQHEDLGERGV